MVFVDDKSVVSAMVGASGRIELEYPARLVEPSPWVGHIPFAMWLIGVLKPHQVVELGVHTGNSYCAFLQAIQTMGLGTRCFGVDHWQGDEHADYYGGEVYHELCAYHDPRYGTFSTLLRTSFNGALPYFSDGSIDLLHIDGFHTYDAVLADFKSWQPKLSARAVVLFHDTNVRERGFGVWKLWEELTSRYPHFEFLHSYGLGVVYVGSEPLSEPLEIIFGARTDAEIQDVQGYFSRLGMSVVDRLSKQMLESQFEKAKIHTAALDADLAAARPAQVLLDREIARVAMLEGELLTARSGASADKMKAEVAELSAELAAAISRLALLDDLKIQVSVLETQLAKASARESELAAANSSLGIANAKAEALKKELTAAKLQIEIKASMTHQRTAIASRLQRELLAVHAEIRSSQQRLEEILQSTSWRLTRPLRQTVTALKRLLPRGPQMHGRSQMDVPSA